MNQIRIHFYGDIAHGHQVSMRTLGKTLSHLQSAMDRAFIENKYGEVWKHARMILEDYNDTEFLVQKPENGGYIIDFLGSNETTKKILDRLSKAMSPAVQEAMSEGEREAQSIFEQVSTREVQVANKLIAPVTYKDITERPSKKIIRKYGDRSITKEIDQILSIIRSSQSGDSEIEFVIKGTNLRRFKFNRELSNNFHSVVSRRTAGDPVIYTAKEVTQLDIKNMNGKIINKDNGKTATIHFNTEAAFLIVKKYLGENKEMQFIGCPVIEYGAFDPQAGDIYFIELYKNGRNS